MYRYHSILYYQKTLYINKAYQLSNNYRTKSKVFCKKNFIAWAHNSIHTYIHTVTNTHSHQHIPTHKRIRTNMLTPALSHTHTQTHTHAHTSTHTRTSALCVHTNICARQTILPRRALCTSWRRLDIEWWRQQWRQQTWRQREVQLDFSTGAQRSTDPTGPRNARGERWSTIPPDT
jgi:hypothetical protein